MRVALTDDLRDLIRLTRTDVAGLSQRQAALAAKLSLPWWRRIETGAEEYAPDETIAKMCYALDISPAQLRAIGQHQVADLVERRRELIGPEAADEAERHLWDTPDTTEEQRASLVAHLRALREVAAAVESRRARE
jgi:transcriptional regulator with XRE-family HTH domain